ncbi:helix-turn-helix domain-containing protein [Ramlibacter alkalitolerans]|uniref:Helix-turn-helix domain-containing protein n=1 Tax=Ramlibacter alkalitolerans TaxID=2039631 RepID=A0ABS1JIC7_9BURK|nr:helix-turn-helix domain-containing protein [Ramlibacter alkalitolerans]MBL0423964.1 helix-turn-helix domain-containing protein [Ramlibacter alkalitolerans]
MDLRSANTPAADGTCGCAPLRQLATDGPPPGSGATAPCVACPASRHCLPAGLGDRDARCLGRLTIARRRVRKGHAIFRENEHFLFLYAVRFGIFKSTLTLDAGAEQITGFHLPGDVIGFDATPSGRHPTTARALEDAEVCVLPYGQLTDACAGQRDLLMRVLRLAGAELERDHRLLALIVHTHSEQRVAAFLVGLSDRLRERGFSPSDFLLRMTRAEIGSYLGTTLETVSRSLSAFARRGFITVHRREIHLVNIEALRAEFEAKDV